jgi:nucleoside-diphosphate-sugar epimerase
MERISLVSGGALNQLLGSSVAPRHASERAGDVRHSRADITRARRELGYDPKVSFEERLRLTLEWYRRKGKTAE